MGPKAASPDERLAFILVCRSLQENHHIWTLFSACTISFSQRTFAAQTGALTQNLKQCMHSLRDANGRPFVPDWKRVSPIAGVKPNSCFVRYREIVNRAIQAGVTGLSPIGTNARAAVPQQASQPTLSSTPGITTAATITSSPIKASGRKRKREVRTAKKQEEQEQEQEQDEDEDEEYAAMPIKVVKNTKTTAVKYPSSRSSKTTPARHQALAQNEAETAATFASSSIDFDTAGNWLQVGGDHRLERSSDADAEGEFDEEY
jgi:hypothetical protein